MMAMLWCVLACALSAAHAQSNYGSQANNIEYQGDGLPEQTILDGKVTKLDDLSPVIFLNRTRATLNCAAGSMQIELKFNEKFYGIAYADFDRHSACQVAGKGATSYKLELPLKGCGTKQDPLRVFTNNIVVRFHPGLEMDGDEVITIVCRYPPPIVPVFHPFILTPEATGPLPAKAPLAGTHILMIICAILFLTLLLLGLGVSYLCLRRRALPAPRRLIDDSSASIISRESIQEVKIPRAHPVYPAESASVASDTLPSDYPSETPSEAEHAHTNQGFLVDEYQSEGYGESHEAYSRMHAHAGGPAFDVRVRVQRPPAPPSPGSTITTTEVDGGSMRQTGLEEHERQESLRTVSPGALPLPARAAHAPPPERPPRPPVLYSEVSRDRQKPPPPPPVMTERLQTEEQEMLMESLEPISETPIMPARKPEITSHVVDDVFLRTITEKKTIEDIERHKRLVTEYRQVPQAPQFDVTIRNHTMPEAQWENFSDISSASGMTLTPKMERVPLSLPPQKFIGKGGPDLFSPELIKQTGAVYPHPSSPDLPLLPELPPARNPLYREEDDEDVPEPNPAPPVPANWSVLTRVLKTEAQDEVLSETERAYRLTRSERLRWRELIAHESTLRRELARASTREEFTRVAHDHRFAPLYEPPKWEVIIRILAPPPDKPKNRYRKKTEWESRSRRSSLPTLYEYDSDAASLREPPRSRRSSYRSDHVDMRSMSEMMVDYAREQADTHSEVSAGTLLGRYYDDDSDSEHHYHQNPSWRHSLHRSASQPSLARSTGELMETWAAPDGDLTPTPGRRIRGAQGVTTFTSSEVRTFQASREWKE
ncbi:unnamed protein product, partial [Brenthis ino]